MDYHDDFILIIKLCKSKWYYFIKCSKASGYRDEKKVAVVLLAV